METRVDLPAPFSPSSASTSPAPSSSETASLATSAPKRLVMPERRRTGAGPVIARPLFRGRLRGLDVGLLGLDLGHHIGRHLLLERAERSELRSLVLHHRIGAVVLGGE